MVIRGKDKYTGWLQYTALVACWEHAEYVTSLAEPVMRLLDRADRDRRKVVIARGSRMIASSNKGPQRRKGFRHT